MSHTSAIPSLQGRRQTPYTKNVQALFGAVQTSFLVSDTCHFQGQHCQAEILGLTHRRVGQVHCWHVAITRQEQTIPP